MNARRGEEGQKSHVTDPNTTTLPVVSVACRHHFANRTEMPSALTKPRGTPTAIKLRIWEVLGSNFGAETGHPD
jgi:hypothetical protein